MYRTLFAIELLHSYFADMKSRGVRIVPTADCERALRRHRMTFRRVGNRVYILGWCDANSVPLITIDPATVFRFYMVVDEPGFHQYTTLPIEPTSNSRLYLSNLSGNSENARLYLTRSIDGFSAGSDYGVGQLAVSGANLFESIKSVTADPGNTTGDGEFWMNRGAVRSPWPGDLLEFAKAEKRFEAPTPVSSTTVEVFGLNRATGNFDAPVLSAALQFAPATNLIPAPFTKLAPGKYRVRVEGVDHFVYWDPDVRSRSVLGVVEVFNHLPGANAFATLDAAGKAKGSIFTVFFLNPLAIWRYTARTSAVKKILDQAGTYEFDNSAALQFISKTPIPITEEAYNRIAMEYQQTGQAKTTYTKIRNPSLGNFTMIDVGTDKLSCAEIFLNY